MITVLLPSKVNTTQFVMTNNVYVMHRIQISRADHILLIFQTYTLH